jgi:hypothetical protein
MTFEEAEKNAHRVIKDALDKREDTRAWTPAKKAEVLEMSLELWRIQGRLCAAAVRWARESPSAANPGGSGGKDGEK